MVLNRVPTTSEFVVTNSQVYESAKLCAGQPHRAAIVASLRTRVSLVDLFLGTNAPPSLSLLSSPSLLSIVSIVLGVSFTSVIPDIPVAAWYLYSVLR